MNMFLEDILLYVQTTNLYLVFLAITRVPPRMLRWTILLSYDYDLPHEADVLMIENVPERFLDAKGIVTKTNKDPILSTVFQ